MSSDNGWAEYSKLVLKELETLATGIEALRTELQDVKQELAKFQSREDKVDELRAWKEKIDEVASPTQLKEITKEVEDLKLFKTKAVTIFAVVQFGMALWAWASKFM
jgi:predicted  nucleic acid-binding Zn-ribbon protein